MRKSIVTYREDGETVSAILWDARRDPNGTVTGIDPATWCPVTIEDVLEFNEGGETV